MSQVPVSESPSILNANRRYSLKLLTISDLELSLNDYKSEVRPLLFKVERHPLIICRHSHSFIFFSLTPLSHDLIHKTYVDDRSRTIISVNIVVLCQCTCHTVKRRVVSQKSHSNKKQSRK